MAQTCVKFHQVQDICVLFGKVGMTLEDCVYPGVRLGHGSVAAMVPRASVAGRQHGPRGVAPQQSVTQPAELEHNRVPLQGRKIDKGADDLPRPEAVVLDLVRNRVGATTARACHDVGDARAMIQAAVIVLTLYMSQRITC